MRMSHLPQSLGIGRKISGASSTNAACCSNAPVSFHLSCLGDCFRRGGLRVRCLQRRRTGRECLLLPTARTGSMRLLHNSIAIVDFKVAIAQGATLTLRSRNYSDHGSWISDHGSAISGPEAFRHLPSSVFQSLIEMCALVEMTK
jgi:hypothetical protein